LGRTDPRGEEGIREMLCLKKGASPDYDDVYTEMQRDKGYGGMAAKKKALKKGDGEVGVVVTTGRLSDSVPTLLNEQEKQKTCRNTSRTSSVEAVPVEDDFVKGLQSRIAKLQATVD